ncbi:hypothetical protein MTR_7g076790 [Medicago truncatula]|uniref:Uncharacterized protein n=1 Tax=Medicago truncatula TaxID=3880 RepID=G7L3J7_MEDTR|nr:hypothetical protein MTR_7g076790 [Medicago truncatula]
MIQQTLLLYGYPFGTDVLKDNLFVGQMRTQRSIDQYESREWMVDRCTEWLAIVTFSPGVCRKESQTLFCSIIGWCPKNESRRILAGGQAKTTLEGSSLFPSISGLENCREEFTESTNLRE